MHAKLTLRLDADLIRDAKTYSVESGKSLSQIVADYFALLTGRTRADEGSQPKRKTTPIVASLRGAWRQGGEVDEADYRRHLEEKYL